MVATTTATTAATTTKVKPKKQRHLASDILVNGALALIVIAWLIPVVGLVASSFRTLRHPDLRLVDDRTSPSMANGRDNPRA